MAGTLPSDGRWRNLAAPEITLRVALLVDSLAVLVERGADIIGDINTGNLNRGARWTG